MPTIPEKIARHRIIASSQKIKWTIHFRIWHGFRHFRPLMVFSISWKTQGKHGAQHCSLVKFSSSSTIFNWTAAPCPVFWLVSSGTFGILAPAASIWMLFEAKSDTWRLYKNDCQLQLSKMIDAKVLTLILSKISNVCNQNRLIGTHKSIQTTWV